MKAHSDIDGRQIGLWGTSQGGPVMALALTQTRDVAFMICVSCPGMSGSDQAAFKVTAWALCNEVPEEKADQKTRLLAELDRARTYDTDAEYLHYRDVLKSLAGLVSAPLEHVPVVSEETWQQNPTTPESSWNPTGVLEQLRIPVLAIFGDRDRALDPLQGAYAYRQALDQAGNPQSHVELFPKARHELIVSKTGCPTDGVYIDGHRTVEGDMSGPVATRMVLGDPFVDVAGLETARGGLLRAGMGVRECDVGAVLNVQADHLGLKGIDTLEELARVKRIVIETARDTAVLNADDPHCLRMADHTGARVICYVTMNPSHPLVREHISAGGRGVVLESGIKGQMITIYDKGTQIPLLWTHLIPATLEGRATHNVQNAMFAAAMAHAMVKKLEDIRHGLRTFDTVLPGARPDERLRRASLQGDPRLRAQHSIHHFK